MLSASALPLKICTPFFDRNTSFTMLHNQLGRATPEQLMNYKHALLLHKTYNDENCSPDWLDLFSNQSFNNRHSYANFIDMSNFKIGKKHLNQQIYPNQQQDQI